MSQKKWEAYETVGNDEPDIGSGGPNESGVNEATRKAFDGDVPSLVRASVPADTDEAREELNDRQQSRLANRGSVSGSSSGSDDETITITSVDDLYRAFPNRLDRDNSLDPRFDVGTGKEPVSTVLPGDTIEEMVSSGTVVDESGEVVATATSDDSDTSSTPNTSEPLASTTTSGPGKQPGQDSQASSRSRSESTPTRRPTEQAGQPPSTAQAAGAVSLPSIGDLSQAEMAAGAVGLVLLARVLGVI